MNYTTGKKYLVAHRRRGNFTIELIAHSEIWVDGVVLSVKTKPDIETNEVEVGQEICLSLALCRLTLIDE